MTYKGDSPTELQTLLENKKYRILKETLSEMNEVDIASFIEELDTEQVLLVFRLLPKDLALDVFACLPIEHMEHIINSIGDMELRDMIEDLYTDDVMDMLEELPATMVKRVIQTATPATRSIINQYLNYPENSAGSIMTAEYVALKKNMTVEQSLNYIRQHGVNKETIYTCYVTNIHRKLEGVITLKNLVMSPSNAIIADIMDEHVMKATTTEDPEEIAYRFNKYNLLSLPVVDHENRIVGIITVDDVMSVLEQETTEDFEKMAAMLPSEKPYLKTSVFTLAKNRILWLLVLMVSSMITGGILASYEEAFAVLPLLVSFIPMLTGTGGNAGSQSSTLVIRGMTLNEIRPKDIFKVVFKEFRVGLLCGIALAAVNYIRLIIFYPGQELICLTVVLSLLLTIIMAKCVGCMLPIGAKKLHLDPAIMAAPLISTIVDAFSLIIYFQIACALLHI